MELIWILLKFFAFCFLFGCFIGLLKLIDEWWQDADMLTRVVTFVVWLPVKLTLMLLEALVLCLVYRAVKSEVSSWRK